MNSTVLLKSLVLVDVLCKSKHRGPLQVLFTARVGYNALTERLTSPDTVGPLAFISDISWPLFRGKCCGIKGIEAD